LEGLVAGVLAAPATRVVVGGQVGADGQRFAPGQSRAFSFARAPSSAHGGCPDLERTHAVAHPSEAQNLAGARGPVSQRAQQGTNTEQAWPRRFWSWATTTARPRNATRRWAWRWSIGGRPRTCVARMRRTTRSPRGSGCIFVVTSTPRHGCAEQVGNTSACRVFTPRQQGAMRAFEWCCRRLGNSPERTRSSRVGGAKCFWWPRTQCSGLGSRKGSVGEVEGEQP
jgi:hypothetical protein